MTPARLIRWLESRGVLLRRHGDRLRYAAPRRAITPSVRSTLAEHRGALWQYLREIDKRAAALRRRPTAELVGHLAARGTWFLVVDGWPQLQASSDTDFDGTDEAVIEALSGRERELVAFLDKTEDDLTDEELDALGYRRREPGARILLDPDHEEPGWVPPPDWGLEP